MDYVFIGSGTVGTLTGISRALKEKDPSIKIIGIDPYGSILAEPESLNTPGPDGGYQIEGIGYDFIPRVADRTLVDEWMKSNDEDSYYYARRLIKEEGFLCGGSSGTAMAACMKYVKEHNIGEGKRCVIICPDNIRNYITKFVSNDWMYEHNFISEQECCDASVPKLVPHNVWGKDMQIKDMALTEAVFLSESSTCKEAIQMMKQKSLDQFPVRNAESGKTVGLVKSSDLTTRLANHKVTMDGAVSEVMTKDFRNMSSGMPISELARVFERQAFVFVDDKFIVTQFDLLEFMSQKM